MNKNNGGYTWIPFYSELAEKLLEYKAKRNALISFIFAENGLLDYSNYLHLKDKTQKINDIDPFSFIYAGGLERKKYLLELEHGL